jgi:ATP/maltotriose-dependent transcriptional regulator MalT
VVGREAEVRALGEFLDGIPSGAAAFVLEGDPGIGKTTLLSAAVTRAREVGYRVLSSMPAPPDAALSFSGLEDLLHDIADEVTSALPAPQRRALEVALLLRDPEGDPPGQLALALAVRGALAALSEPGPVVVAVDDAQWLDDPTAFAVGHAVRRLGAAPVGLLAAVQGEAATRAALMGSLGPDVRRHRVGPMDSRDLRSLLRSRLGLALSGGRVERLHRACAGNPLAALEIGRAMVESGDRRAAGSMPVPDELVDLLRDRIDALSEAEREALLVMAVVPDPTRSLVEAVAGESAGAALAEAMGAGIVDDDDGALRFRHPLFGSVLYASAAEQARRRLHGRVARVVGDPQDRAMHLALAAEGPDAAVAAEVEAAARAARARGAPSAAADLAEQARRLTPADASDDSYRRAILAAEYLLDSGELDRSRELLEEFLAADPPEPVRAAALQRLGWVRYHQDSWGTASELFREASHAARSDPALQAVVDLDRAVACLVAGDLPAAATHAASARDRAAALEDPPLLAQASAMVASVDFLLGRGIDQETVDRTVAMETWTRPGPTAARPSVAFGVLLKWSGELERSRMLLRQALGELTQRGAERSLPFVLFHLSEVECWLGEWAEAERHALAGVEAAEATGQEAGSAFALSALALVRAHRGREDDARAAATDGLARASAAGVVPAAVACEWALGLLELSLGRPQQAHRHLGPLIEGAAAGGIHEPGAMPYLGDALEALVSVGDVESAEFLIVELQRRSEELDRAWGLLVAARCRALTAAARGELEDARVSAEAAVACSERVGQPFELGRTLLVHGTVERRDRRKRSARDSLERAVEVFSGLGADLWAARARQELSRIGGRAPSSVSLTPTEERIARLVADGASNQEVASSVFLSLKTVEWNLTRIYRKLGVRSRTELARWVSRDPPIRR